MNNQLSFPSDPIIRLLTCRSEYLEQIQVKAFEQVISKHNNVDELDEDILQGEIDTITTRLIESGTEHVYEYVFIGTEEILICLNVDRIDDNTVMTFISKLSQVLDDNSQTIPCYWQSSDPLTFSLVDCSDLLHQHL